MAFSLSSWFKGKPGGGNSEEISENPPQGKGAPPSKPSSAARPANPPPAVRTVMPSSNSPVSLRPTGAPRPEGAPPTTRSLPVRPPARKVSFPIPSAVSVVAVAPPPISMSSPPPRPADPDAPDVTVNLEVGDFIDRLPPGLLQEGAFDRQRVIEFRASELYSDLAKGRASVPASTIYAKCPEIFSRPISDTEDVEIQLPLQKLVEQLSAAFTTRADQVAEENVGQIETPFLQVANEDNARVPKAAGSSTGAIRPTVELPAVPLAEAASGLPTRPARRTSPIGDIGAKPASEVPPAPSFASPTTAPISPGKRPPSTVRASVAGGKIRLSGPAASPRMASVPAVPPPPAKPPSVPSASQRIELPMQPAALSGSPTPQVTKRTARITIPPISLRPPSAGTGTTPRPGAIPPPPSVPVQPGPVSIRPTAGAEPPAVKLPPTFASQRPSFPPPKFPAIPPMAGTPSASAPEVPETTDERTIELGLAAVLRGLPSFTLAVEPSDVPDDARFTLPFGLVEKQLLTGRVSVARQVFVDALPEAYRHVLSDDCDSPEVQIPLQEVFQNLPGDALSIRHDQVTEEIGLAYSTPFSQKADEDAERLGTVAPVTPLVSAAATAPETVEENSEKVVEDGAPTTEAAREETPGATLAPAIEEYTPAEGLPGATIDQPSRSAEAPEVTEDVSPETEPARDVPLDEDESAAPEFPPAQVLDPTDSVAQGDTAAVAESEPLLLEPLEETHLAAPAVEPPVTAEPPPIEEALAVLESTAPGAKMEEPTADGADLSNLAVTARVETPTPEPIPLVESVTPHADVAAPRDSELQSLFMTEEELDAKGVVRLVCQLPGLTGCAVMFADGLRLAGNFPDGDSEGFSAMAPPFFKRTVNFAHEADLGELQAITLYTNGGLLSFFLHDDICVGVRHAGRGFLPGVREKLAVVTRELARMYSSEKPADSSDNSL